MGCPERSWWFPSVLQQLGQRLWEGDKKPLDSALVLNSLLPYPHRFPPLPFHLQKCPEPSCVSFLVPRMVWRPSERTFRKPWNGEKAWVR